MRRASANRPSNNIQRRCCCVPGWTSAWVWGGSVPGVNCSIDQRHSRRSLDIQLWPQSPYTADPLRERCRRQNRVARLRILKRLRERTGEACRANRGDRGCDRQALRLHLSARRAQLRRRPKVNTKLRALICTRTPLHEGFHMTRRRG